MGCAEHVMRTVSSARLSRLQGEWCWPSSIGMGRHRLVSLRRAISSITENPISYFRTRTRTRPHHSLLRLRFGLSNWNSDGMKYTESIKLSAH
ncbi:unnamed protein product [Mycena citricolor]|uniref:Uncharacterized protein n=1 Tax=Mycena citricolor TaxID=2018698 RepID=A0AAD2HI98_9AGAR|nr:unnamed protein product [Mycena citricolor]